MLRRLRIENLVLIREAELELAPGFNVLTGETGAGKTIFAQAIGLLLGARGDPRAVGPAGTEAYVEAELELPDAFFDDDEELERLAELRPAGETGLVLARRVLADGRTRAYAWGRAVAREDLATASERLIAMSGQFEQRRLARPAYQLDVLDAFCGAEQLERRRAAARAWRELTALRRRHAELERDAGAEHARLDELQALVEATESFRPGEEDELRDERERLRHAAELEIAAAAAASAIAPEDGEGAAALAASAERAIAPFGGLAPELGERAAELRDLALRLQDAGGELRRLAGTFEAHPERLDAIEELLDRYADARRRFRTGSTAELLEQRDAARAELEQAGGAGSRLAALAAARAEAEASVRSLAEALREARWSARDELAAAVAGTLREVGMGEGELVVEIVAREPGATGADEVSFLIRPNPGLPLGPVSEVASGGELSRVALALAAVAGGETLVFDEIDAGIGGVTAHRVADALARLARDAQVLAITHLPQIARVADRHFLVEKTPGGPTLTRIEPLDGEARQAELERMLGGQEFLASVAGERRAARGA